jgi:hypothetical protein
MNPTITDPRPQRAMIRATPHAPRRRVAFWLMAFVFAATVLLAALCVFALASIARTLVPGRAVRQ